MGKYIEKEKVLKTLNDLLNGKTAAFSSPTYSEGITDCIKAINDLFAADEPAPEANKFVCPKCGCDIIRGEKSEIFSNFAKRAHYIYRIRCTRCGNKTSACDSFEAAEAEWRAENE